MWDLFEHRNLDSKLKSVPIQVLKRYEKWKDIAAISGLLGLGMVKGFHDEALKGRRQGSRSSRLGQKRRVIYQVDGKDFLILGVTPHDYRRK